MCKLVLDIDFQQQHKSMTLHFGGDKPDLNICHLATLKIEPPLFFQNLSNDCKPINSLKIETFQGT